MAFVGQPPGRSKEKKIRPAPREMWIQEGELASPLPPPSVETWTSHHLGCKLTNQVKTISFTSEAKVLKVAIFRKCDLVFKSPNFQTKNIPKIYPELETIVNNKFKFQAQDSFLEYFYFWRLGDLKN